MSKCSLWVKMGIHATVVYVTKQMCWGPLLRSLQRARVVQTFTGLEAKLPGNCVPKLGVGNEGRECLHPGSLVEGKSIKDLTP